MWHKRESLSVQKKQYDVIKIPTLLYETLWSISLVPSLHSWLGVETGNEASGQYELTLSSKQLHVLTILL